MPLEILYLWVSKWHGRVNLSTWWFFGTIGGFHVPSSNQRGRIRMKFYYCWPKITIRVMPVILLSSVKNQLIHRAGKTRKSQNKSSAFAIQTAVLNSYSSENEHAIAPQNWCLEDYFLYLPFEMASKIEDIRSFSGGTFVSAWTKQPSQHAAWKLSQPPPGRIRHQVSTQQKTTTPRLGFKRNQTWEKTSLLKGVTVNFC